MTDQTMRAEACFWAQDKNCPQAIDRHLKDRLHEEERARLISATEINGQTSDGYHTFDELYHYRMLYNALSFNLLAAFTPIDVHKSWHHSDGDPIFGGGWFIVVAQLPTGQITNHYEAPHWDDFRIPERDFAAEYDYHTPQEAAERLATFLASFRGNENAAGA